MIKKENNNLNIAEIASLGVLLNRNKQVKVADNIHYLPEIIIKKHVNDIPPKVLSKHDKRRLRIRFHNKTKLIQNDDNNNGDDDEIIYTSHKTESNSLFSSISSKIGWLSNKLTSTSIVMNESSYDKLESDSNKQGLYDTNSDEFNIDNNNESSKSKRFISQDRLTRQEARKLLFKPAEEVIEKHQIETKNYAKDVLTLLNLESRINEKIEEIVNNRKEQRQQKKAAIEGYVDVVHQNAGPPIDSIPKGYMQSLNMIGEELINPSLLVYQRILYFFESHGSKSKAQGWYIGTVVGTSEVKGYNYRIKYDRAETETYLVDGVHKVMLSLSGEHAYGRRWVIVEKVSNDLTSYVIGKSMKDITS